MAIKIAVDAGHGTDTVGKYTAPFNKEVNTGSEIIKTGQRYKEHYANVHVAYRLSNALSRCGFDVYKTGFNDDNPANDPDVDLTTRQNHIRNYGCMYSVSVHFNAYGNASEFNSANGLEVYYHNDTSKARDGKRMAESVHKYLITGTKQTDRGVKSQNLAMCNSAAMRTRASILVELAFMTNEHEAYDMMANQQYWDESAEEICKGICTYAGVEYVAPNTSLPSGASSWAKEAVQWGIRNKILLGDPDGNLKLKNTCSRQEVITFLYRLRDLGR